MAPKVYNQLHMYNGSSDTRSSEDFVLDFGCGGTRWRDFYLSILIMTHSIPTVFVPR